MKKCVVTIVNKEYLGFLEKFLYFYKKNSSFDLIVYTVNLNLENETPGNIKYITYFDEALAAYESGRPNDYIKSDVDKYKYTTALKPKILNSSLLLDYDCFLYLDADCIITPSFNDFYQSFNAIKNQYPLCPILKDDFMVYDGIGNPFVENTFDEKKILGNDLLNYFGVEYKKFAYRHTFAFFYNKKCYSFFAEAVSILFNKELFKEYKKFFPLLDETVFNFLLCKSNAHECLGVFPILDFNLNFLDLDGFKNFARKDEIACFHAKFSQTDETPYLQLESVYNKDFSSVVYSKCFIKDGFFVFDFTVGKDLEASLLVVDNYGNFLHRGELQFYIPGLFYFISCAFVKKSNIQLIFLDRRGIIIDLINETLSR